MRAEEAELRLFCFPHAGGGAAFFRPWRQRLAPELDVRTIVLPGREARVREAPYRRVEQLLGPVCEALEPLLDRPYALLGHSLGAIVAFEVARRLVTGGAPAPRCLLVSGRRSPRAPRLRRRYSALPDMQFLAAIGELGGTPPEVLAEPQLVRMLLPALRADFEINESYQVGAGPLLRCPVIAYAGRDDPEVDPGELVEWHEATSGEFALRLFDGGHFYLRGGRPDVVACVRQDLWRCLDRPQERSG
ncbi:MAG: thioesterase [Actinobacteria bacterium]|nr:thioesterase [Actinomycetota bacterium]